MKANISLDKLNELEEKLKNMDVTTLSRIMEEYANSIDPDSIADFANLENAILDYGEDNETTK